MQVHSIIRPFSKTGSFFLRKTAFFQFLSIHSFSGNLQNSACTQSNWSTNYIILYTVVCVIFFSHFICLSCHLHVIRFHSRFSACLLIVKITALRFNPIRIDAIHSNQKEWFFLLSRKFHTSKHLIHIHHSIHTTTTMEQPDSIRFGDKSYAKVCTDRCRY